MANITKVTVSINETIEKVWALFINPDNLKHWLTGFVSAEHISGKPFEPGSKSKLVFKERGRTVEVVETVLEVQPNQHYRFKMENKSFDIETDIRLVSFGNRTELIQTEQFHPKGFFMKLMMGLMKGQMKKRLEKELDKFKRFVESRER